MAKEEMWKPQDGLPTIQIAFANEMTNRVYANPLVAASFGRSLETAFQFGYILDAFRPVVNPRWPAPVIDPRRTSIETRGADHAEAAAEYRTAARTRRPRRAAAA
jgi:hypothetical protein